MNGRLTFLVISILLSIIACKEKEIYSNIPAIEYQGVSFLRSSNKDSIMKLLITFKDGDGDIGLGQGDTFSPFNPVFDSVTFKSLNAFYYNCYISYKQKVDGAYLPYVPPGKTDTFLYEYRIQNLTPEGRHKAIRGELYIDIPKAAAQLISPFKTDTIIYGIYIYDRALNKSNLIETPPIIWRR